LTFELAASMHAKNPGVISTKSVTAVTLLLVGTTSSWHPQAANMLIVDPQASAGHGEGSNRLRGLFKSFGIIQIL
jgi:hypothetical protein